MGAAYDKFCFWFHQDKGKRLRVKKSGEPMQNTADGIKIRDFTMPDTDAVISLWRRCGLTRPWNDPRKDIQRKIEELSKGGTGWFWVVETSRQIVGAVMVGYDGHRGSVNYLAVDPDSQTQGIGRLMMQRAEAELTAAGCPKINLLVRTDNTQVLKFYDQLGYEVDAVTAVSRRLVDDQKTTQ